MTDFFKIIAWFIICMCIVVLAGRIFELQKDVEQLKIAVQIEQEVKNETD